MENIKHRTYLASFFFPVLILAFFISCKKEDKMLAVLPAPSDSLQNINRWILDSMNHYYYWNDRLQNITSLEGNATVFFDKLLNVDDKFSFISDEKNILPPSNSQQIYGFHYMLISDYAFSQTDMLGVVLLVTKQSSAEAAGLKRGMFFSKVNGLSINSSTLSSIRSDLNSGNSSKLNIVEYTAEQKWIDKDSKTVTKQYFENRPVYETKLFEKNGIKTGYLFYNSFNETFDQDLLNAFEKFKNNSVKELIIDLRYNAGGSVASAAKFCALLANVNQDNIWGIYKGNKNFKLISQSFINAINTSGNSAGKNLDDLKAMRSSLKRVFILTTRNTLSSAEMLLNNLKPYLNVIQIGETSYGKDMAATLIKDTRLPKHIFWTLHPLVFKLYNANNSGEYSEGIAPNISVNELSEIPLSSLGSNTDPLIKKALEIIYNTNNVSIENLMKRSAETDEKLVKKRKVEKIYYNSIDELSKKQPSDLILNFR